MRYEIQRGDTLGGIAKRFGTTVQKLASKNRIMNVDRINAGNTIIVPDMEKPTIQAQVETVTRPRSPLSSMIGDKVISRTTPEIQRSQEDLQRTPTMNPRTKAIKSKTTAPVESKSLMARSQEKIIKKPETEEESKGFVGRVLDYLKTTPGKAYAKSWIDSGVWDESILEKDEFELQQEIATQNVNRGLQKGSYKHFTDEGGSKMSYQMETPKFDTAGQALQYLLGQHEYVRKGNDLLTADEYDYGETGPDAIKNQSFVDRVRYVYDKFQDYRAGKIKDYGFAHHLAEAFGATPGEGASVRINLGNYKDLGISPEMFKRLPTIEDYETKYKDRITQRPLRDLLTSTYDKTKSLLVG